MLDPVFFLKTFSHPTLSSASHYGVVSALLEDVHATVGDLPLDFLSSVLTVMTLLLLQLTALTEEAWKQTENNGPAQLEEKKKKKIRIVVGKAATRRFKAV